MSDLLRQYQEFLPAIEKKPDAWICPICGPVEPFLRPDGRYIARTCACQRRAKHEALEAEKRQEQLQTMAERTFGKWLGDEWFDVHACRELSARCFEQYDTERKEEYQRLVLLHSKETDLARRELRKKEAESFLADRRSWKNAKEKAMMFAENPQGIFIIYGPSGLGKSTLLYCIANALRNRPVPVSSLVTTVPKFFMALYDRMNHESDVWNLVRQASTTPLLFLEEPDKINPKESKKEILFQIIEERVAAGRPIAMSVNDMQGLASYIGDNAYSRLMDGCIPVKVTGKDYRSTRVVR